MITQAQQKLIAAQVAKNDAAAKMAAQSWRAQHAHGVAIHGDVSAHFHATWEKIKAFLGIKPKHATGGIPELPIKGAARGGAGAAARPQAPQDVHAQLGQLAARMAMAKPGSPEHTALVTQMHELSIKA